MKRLCILQTDSVLPEYQQQHGDYPAMFKALLACEQAQFFTVDARQPLPADLEADGYLITGSRHSVYEDLPWIPPLVALLRRAMSARVPIVGICFGHQLIAHFFGGQTRKSDAGWGVGAHRATVDAPQRWMQPPADTFTILSSHQDQVVRLPEGAQRIASTPFCPISGYVIDDRVLCFQGHPEFEKPYSEALMRHRREILGAPTLNAGIDSLSQPLDRELVAGWILRFFGVLEAGDG